MDKRAAVFERVVAGNCSLHISKVEQIGGKAIPVFRFFVGELVGIAGDKRCDHPHINQIIAEYWDLEKMSENIEVAIKDIKRTLPAQEQQETQLSLF